MQCVTMKVGTPLMIFAIILATAILIEAYPQSQEATVLPDYYIEISPGNLYIIFHSIEVYY